MQVGESYCNKAFQTLTSIPFIFSALTSDHPWRENWSLALKLSNEIVTENS